MGASDVTKTEERPELVQIDRPSACGANQAEQGKKTEESEVSIAFSPTRPLGTAGHLPVEMAEVYPGALRYVGIIWIKTVRNGVAL